MRTLTELFKALSQETRLLMLGLLLEAGELCVCDFVEVLELTQSTASRHLRHLVRAGLLDDRRSGTWVYFRIADEPGPAQAKVLEVLPRVLADRMPPQLFERQRRWRAHKTETGGPCKEKTS